MNRATHSLCATHALLVGEGETITGAALGIGTAALSTDRSLTMPSHLERAYEHLARASSRMTQISTRTLKMLLECLARLSAMLAIEEQRQLSLWAA